MVSAQYCYTVEGQMGLPPPLPPPLLLLLLLLMATGINKDWTDTQQLL
jgi:hypothetical protein